MSTTSALTGKVISQEITKGFSVLSLEIVSQYR